MDNTGSPVPIVPLFALGQIRVTHRALAALRSLELTPTEFLDRHVQGFWGDMSEDSRRRNDADLDAVRLGGSRETLHSYYQLGSGQILNIST